MNTMFTPFSDNLIFLDTEFTDLDVKKGELLSVGLVRPNGESLYLEIEHKKERVHPWVLEHVYPYLQHNFLPAEEVRTRMLSFIGGDKPYMMAYVNQFDAVYWYQLFQSTKEQPFYWIPIDFASILFAHGFDPSSMGNKKFLSSLGIQTDEFTRHHALDDARLLCKVYYALLKFIQTS